MIRCEPPQHFGRQHQVGGLDWYLDLGRDGHVAERVVGFGLKRDIPVAGDFDVNGRDDFVAVRYDSSRGGLDWHID